MTNEEWSQIVTEIEGLWPTYRFPPARQQERFVNFARFYTATDVRRVLSLHRADEPDRASPFWKALAAFMKEKMQASTTSVTSPLTKLIAQIKTATIKQDQVTGRDREQSQVQTMSDEETFKAFVAGNTYLVDAKGQRRPDPDGRLARDGRRVARMMYAEWQDAVRAAGAIAPAWLCCPYCGENPCKTCDLYGQPIATT